MKKRGLVVLAVGGFVLLVLALVWLVIVPRIVASKIAEAADKRALAIRYDGAAYRFTYATVDDAVITAKSSKVLTVKVPRIEARLSGLRPSSIVVPRADVELVGGIDDVIVAARAVRDADDKLPAAERVPIDVTAGTLKWRQPFGAGTSIAFGTLSALARPAEGVQQAKLGKGHVDVLGIGLDGLAIQATRTKKKTERLDLLATLASEEGNAKLEAHRSDDGTEVDLSIDALSLGSFSAAAPGLDLSKAAVDGEMHGELSSEGAVRSNGKITLSKVRLPPIKAGPVSVVIGGSVKLTWKGSPKKGSPGTMKIDDGKIEVTLGGKPRVVKVSGDVSIGEHGEGPYEVKLDWQAGPIPCTEIAQDLAAAVGGGLAKGLVAGAVSGSITARGTVEGDLAALDDLHKTMTLDEACKVEIDLGKGASDLLKKIPF